MVGAKRTPRGAQTRIRSRKNPRLRQDTIQVVFRHREEKRARATQILLENLTDEGTWRRGLSARQDLSDRLARARLRVGMPRATDHDRRPITVLGIDLGNDARTDDRVRQSCTFRGTTALTRPIRKHDIKVRTGATERISIAAEKISLGHRTLDLRQHVIELAPVLRPARLEMRDLTTDTGRLRQIDHFVDGLENAVSL